MALNFESFRDFDRAAATLLSTQQAPKVMPLDLYRDNDTYIVSADLPGIDPGSVDVDIDGQVLTIRAERTLSSGDGVKWITRERQSGSYLRRFTLGQGIDTERISANYANGVLSVTIPVSEKAKPRKITVATGTPETVTVTETAPETVAA
jgi:HSP20 family protein